jgi:putative nucleotidyltransferase with HDIG domain
MYAQEIKVGVLAKRGNERTIQKWSETAKYLSENIKEYNFKIVPLEFDEIDTSVKRKEIDFILANPAIYVNLEYKYNVSRIATMQNLSNTEDSYYTKFGGVVFVKKSRRDISEIKDLENKHISAVDKTSFGGFLVGLKEIEKNGIQRENLKISFANTHDEVVYSVLNGNSDAGIVRTDTLERMAREDKITLSDIYVLNKKEYQDFNFIISTELYPEWAFAKLNHTKNSLSQQVAIALLKMDSKDKCAIDAKINGWTIPLSYQSVHDTLRYLKTPPYDIEQEVTLQEFLLEYWYIFVSGFILLFISFIISLYFRNINRVLSYTKKDLENEIKEKVQTELKLLQTQKEMIKLNSQLEEKVEERTKSIEEMLKKERYLKDILKTIADVNQVIIVSTNLNELIQNSCSHLMEYKNYTYAWIGLFDDERKFYLPNSKNNKFVEYLQGSCDDDSESSAKNILECRVMKNNSTLIIENIQECPRLSTNEKIEYNKSGINSLITLALRKDIYSKPFGILSVYSDRVGLVDIEEIRMLEELAGDLGFAINSFRQDKELKCLQDEKMKNYEETILSFVNMIEQRDSYTVGHTSRVAKYCKMLAEEMDINESDITRLYKAAILHDIGKISTPDAILLKPYKLTELEFKIIQEHVIVGYDMLSKIESYKDLAEIIKFHHEKYDGTGYPSGLSGENIPLLSRIMVVADSFDAMTSQRIYKMRKTPKEAIDELIRFSGTQFDPEIVKIAIKVFKDLKFDESSFQLPETDIEKERMAYFYKDQLSTLYNKDYLVLMIKNKDKLSFEYKNGMSINIKNFSHFNKTKSWEDGNKLLKEFSEYLLKEYKSDTIFRIDGDDFLILSTNEIDKTNLEDKNMVLNKNNLEFEVKKSKIDFRNIESISDIKIIY